jgi:hypothetical protein
MKPMPSLLRSVPLLLSLLSLHPAAFCGEAALRFSGAQGLTVPAFRLDSHTVEAWARPEGDLPLGFQAGVIFDWDGRVAIRNSLAGLDYSLDLGGPDLVHLVIPALPSGEWHHVAANFDGTQMKLFLDGKVALAKQIVGNVAGAGDANASFGSPAAGLERSAPFTGILDDVRVWGRARTPDEVDEAVYDHLRGDEAGLLGAWDLDEGQGQKASDIAGLRNAVLGTSPVPDGRDPAWTDAIAPVRKPTPGFSLGFDPPGPISLKAGQMLDASCTLTTAAGVTAGGVTSWSISVRHDRAFLTLEDVSLIGTGADLRLSDGYVKVEWVDDTVRSGFVSTVVLSEGGGAALSPVGTYKVARMRYRTVLNYRDSADAWIRFDERLPDSTLGPARNTVTADGIVRLPAEGRLTVSIAAPETSLSLDPPLLARLPGQEAAASIVLATAENPLSTGAIAWSLSVAHDSSVLDLIEVTTAGTALDAFDPDEIFLLTETVDNETGTGFISVAILNISGLHSLPPNGKSSLGKVRYRVREGVEIGTRTKVSFLDGLRGSGIPIANQVTFAGGVSEPPASDLGIAVTKMLFLRGNANGDASVNISDPAFLLNRLFRSGPAPRCDDAADVNDDGRFNISDPIFLLEALFKGGQQPPAPYPQAGDDPTADTLECGEYP